MKLEQYPNGVSYVDIIAEKKGAVIEGDMVTIQQVKFLRPNEVDSVILTKDQIIELAELLKNMGDK